MLNDHQPSFSGNALSALRALIGQEAILLPVPWGQKGPVFAGWNKTTNASMEDPVYLASLEHSNVGVLLGEASQGLCTIDFDDDDAAVEFERLNPRFADTLQTRGKRGCNYWIKVEGEFPGTKKLLTSDGQSWGEFRASGSQTIISGRHPDGMDYEIIVKAQPMSIAFADIVWPEALANPPRLKDAYDTLVEAEGHLLSRDKKGTFTINQPALAEKFVMENVLVYEADEKEFYQYNGETGLYQEVSAQVLGDRISGNIMSIADDVRNQSLKFKRTPSLHKSIVELLRGKLERRGIFTREAKRIHVKNGVIELSSTGGQLWGFHPDFVSRTQIPLDFDPTATCPRFINEFLRPALAAEDIDLIQIYCGSMLLGRNSSQRILLMEGAAGSGKSTLLNIVEALLGRDNVAELRLEHLNGRFELYSARKAVLLAGKDVKSDYLSSPNANSLKKLTGGDLVASEKKGGEHFSIKGEFHVVITSNSRLQVALDGDHDAWARRLMHVEFNRPAQDRSSVPDFDKVLLRDEGSGILNFLLEGAMRFLALTEAGTGLTLTPAQSARVDEILLESDSVAVFAVEGMEACDGNEISGTVLYSAYMDFCEAKGWDPKPAITFAKDVAPLLLDLYQVKKRHDISGSQRGYKGIRVK